MLENTSDNLSKFRTRNCVEINDESRGIYANSDIRFKTTMLRSNLCDYADSYILVKGTITITAAGANADAERADERDKGVTFKNCAELLNGAQLIYLTSEHSEIFSLLRWYLRQKMPGLSILNQQIRKWWLKAF